MRIKHFSPDVLLILVKFLTGNFIVSHYTDEWGYRTLGTIRQNLNKTQLLIIIGLSSLVTSSAHAFEFSLFGGLNRSSTTATTDSQNSYFFGFAANIVQTEAFAIEYNALYLPRKFEINGSQQNFTFIEVPILLRIFLGPVFSVAIGPSVARAMSKEGVLQRDYDLGATAGSGMALPIGSSGASVLIEVRYRWGFSDLGVGSFRDTQALVGLKIGGERGLY